MPRSKKNKAKTRNIMTPNADQTAATAALMGTNETKAATTTEPKKKKVDKSKGIEEALALLGMSIDDPTLRAGAIQNHIRSNMAKIRHHNATIRASQNADAPTIDDEQLQKLMTKKSDLLEATKALEAYKDLLDAKDALDATSAARQSQATASNATENSVPEGHEGDLEPFYVGEEVNV